MSNRASYSRPLLIGIVGLLLIAAAAAVYNVIVHRRGGLPQPGSERYEQVTRAFYRGLASLEVGLLDDARREFMSATELVEVEPAPWANLGLTRMRLGELDEASAPIERALSLSPDNADLVLLAGRMEIARGRLDEGIAHLRRAVALEPDALRARFALADEVERAGGPDADAQALALLDELAQRAPDNAAVQVERARVAGKARDTQRFRQAVAALEAMSTGWPPLAVEQFNALRDAAASGDLSRAAVTTTLLRNVLTSVPAFIESLSAVRTPTELIAEPIDRFVVLTPPPATPAAADTSLTFAAEPIDGLPSARAVVALHDSDGAPRIVGTDDAAVSVDWNNDFRTDLLIVSGGGLRLRTRTDDGGFTEQPVPVMCACTAAWPADIEMDGDLDIVAAEGSGDPLVLRNNGNGTWTEQRFFPGVAGARAFAWADLDSDADPDAAFIDGAGVLHLFRNRQAGDFVRIDAANLATDAVALTIADVNADSVFDLVVLERGGAVRRLFRRLDTWAGERIATWDGLTRASPGTHRLLVADLDNSGSLDLIASGAGESRIWLADEGYRFAGLQAMPDGEVLAAVDLTNDGRLDLLALAAGGPVRLVNRGTRGYHWKVVRPRAQPNAGDQRINSFGVGGDIDVRSGLLAQKQVLSGAPVHIGLGERTEIDVARIVWPNGVAQAEFGLDVDDELVAEQRLKGSCPWVFAWDGSRMAFVTDFLWRSPLGLRINAQDTAGVVQTEDWVRISGAQLAPRNGAYDVRITAELWETHFFDHVSLMVVDHPAGTEVFVDERFSAAAPPVLKLHAVEGLRPVSAARDHRGADVTDIVARRDGEYLATFAKGAYQGIAEEHFVEFDVEPGPRATLLANGWIYPTDSSINVAIGQGGHVTPMGLALEARHADGTWRMVNPDLGFPAGKHKTVVIDLAQTNGARRLRLRTNLEIYWDWIAYGEATDAPLRTVRVQTETAELRFRGFSETTSLRAEVPETPDYDRVATTSQRWRDLTGYHTRFGDVKELLGGVDDRYVMMNAGDELRMTFREQPAPPDGWTRDFVLIGDGWEKDGDYNTGFSQTVLPLPSHDKPAYGEGVTSLELEDDPVYQRHKRDWERYHTRYVTPRQFVGGLRRF